MNRQRLRKIRRYDNLPFFTHAVTLDTAFFREYLPAFSCIAGNEILIFSRGKMGIQSKCKQDPKKTTAFLNFTFIGRTSVSHDFPLAFSYYGCKYHGNNRS